jgi:hypothetical protein
MPPIAVIAIVAIAVVMTIFVCRVEGLGFFAPANTRSLAGSAQTFCLGDCRLSDGQCHLAMAGMARKDCPLWRYVNADLSTTLRLNPSAPVG